MWFDPAKFLEIKKNTRPVKEGLVEVSRNAESIPDANPLEFNRLSVVGDLDENPLVPRFIGDQAVPATENTNFFAQLGFNPRDLEAKINDLAVVVLAHGESSNSWQNWTDWPGWTRVQRRTGDDSVDHSHYVWYKILEVDSDLDPFDTPRDVQNNTNEAMVGRMFIFRNVTTAELVFSTNDSNTNIPTNSGNTSTLYELNSDKGFIVGSGATPRFNTELKFDIVDFNSYLSQQTDEGIDINLGSFVRKVTTDQFYREGRWTIEVGNSGSYDATQIWVHIY
jgi:hypothetical protein